MHSRRLLIFLVLVVFVNVDEGSSIDDDFCITPDNSSNSGCNFYQLNVTLDGFVENHLQRLKGATRVKLTFLRGTHNLTLPMAFESIKQVNMTGTGDSLHQALIHMQTGGIVVLNTSKLEVANLAIDGSGLYSFMIQKSPENGNNTMNQVHVHASAIQLKDTCARVNISYCSFNASMLEVKFSGACQQYITVFATAFISGEQSHTIAISSQTLTTTLQTFNLSLELNNVTIVNMLESPHSLHPSPFLWKDTLSSNISSNVIIFGVQVHLNIIKGHFSGSYGNGIQVHNCSHSRFTISNSTFSDYTQGVLLFADNLDNTDVKLNGVHMVNNSINAGSTVAPGVVAATLTVYPSSNPRPASTRVEVENCEFKKNADNVGNLQIVLLHMISNVSIKNTVFISNNGTTISADESEITFIGQITFEGNVAFQGGALSLTSAQIHIANNATINFTNNSTTRFGGVIYVNDPLFYLQNYRSTRAQCFYQPLNYNFTGITLNFSENTAEYGGDNIYGITINNYCKTIFDHTLDELNKWHEIFKPLVKEMGCSLSSVSSNPLRICVCDKYGHPQCADEHSILNTKYTVYPGEEFNIDVVVVGTEFGTTVGQVFAEVLTDDSDSNHSVSVSPYMQRILKSDACTSLNFSIRSNKEHETIYLASADIHLKYYNDIRERMRNAIQVYNTSIPHVIPFSLLTTPIMIDITLNQSCPLGFMLVGDPPHCDCYSDLSEHNVTCTVANGTGYIFRERNTWIGSTQNQMFFSSHCPYSYCESNRVQVNLASDQDIQCARNRSGFLCGRCREGNYSVAIGSSRCIPCANNGNLALLIVFVAAGPQLYMLIATAGLTITKGTINGLLFYANIVWINQNTIFSNTDQDIVQASRAFIAWLNLDFGIEMCFIRRLDAFGKSLLQYTFPVYIWIIAAAIAAVYK